DRPGMRIRTEVTDSLALRAAHHLRARKLLVERDREPGIRLVVAIADVEPRVELFDPAVLELERLDLGADDGPLDRSSAAHHRLGARVQVEDVLEVRRQPAAETLRLADVDDPAVLVAEPVDARLVRNRSRGWPVGCGISHRASPHSLSLHRPLRQANPAHTS